MKALIVLLLVLPMACSKGPSSMKPNQATPQNTVRKMMEATEKGDLVSFRECIDCTDKHNELLAAMFEYAQAGIRFRKELVEVFGPGAVEEMGQEDHLMSPALADPAWIDKLEFKINGDVAECSQDKHENSFPRMVRKDGKWKVPFDESAFQPPKIFIELFRESAKAISDSIPDIHKPGMTVEKLKKTIFERMK